MSHSMSSPRNIQLVFETYQKARLVFVQTMAELATRATNVKCLESAGVLDLLRPLLSDACSTVRQCAVVAAARLGEHDEGVARQLLNSGMITITLENLNKYNVYYKRSALYLMRAVAKHNEELASAVVRLGALEHIVSCLEDFDTQVKENAAWALGYIGKHNEQLAGLVVDAGTLPLLVLAFQEPEMSLKQISAGALVDLAQHKPEAVVDAGAICHLVHGLENQDPKLKRSTLCALGAVAGARSELAEAVVAGGALPPALLHAGHDTAPVRRAAAALIRDIVKHSVDLAQLVVNTGGCGPLVELLAESTGGARVPACMALGFIAGQSDQLAMAVVESKAIPALVEILQNTEAEDAEICACAWTLGHVAKHSPQHSLAVAVANAFPRLLQLYTNPKSSGEVRARTSCALKQSLQCCLHRPALEPLLHAAPACILKYVLAQYAKILPNDARARRLFVTTGALKRVQEIDSVPGTSLKEYINIINSCFPEEIVRYYTPGYSDSLLDRVEAYTPQDIESPVADICWSPNNVKLAVATCERLVLLFDRDGTRRDKFSTKPADSSAGKKSYVITSISFSDSSELLGVAQSDSMVFVYRVGADWSGKKVICNKFPLTGAPIKLLPAENGFFTGTSDGKIRSLDCKSNKSSSVWTAGACCVSLARSSEGTLASGHVDGTLYVSGRLLLRYALPPSALALLPPHLIVGSCDGRVSVYEIQRGALLRSLEPSLPLDQRDLITAVPSPSGQTVAFGVFDGCLIGEMKESGSLELSMLNIPNLYAGRALAWSGDGTKLAVASQTGAVIQLEAVLKRWVWRDTVEVQHVSPKQLVVTRLANDSPPLTITTKHATDIFNVRFIGNDWYAVCRTSSTLILCDIARGLTSEIPWSGGGERIYAAVGGACLLHRAGELSLVEYGLDKVLHTVRTERVNPHVLSVRINEGKETEERKHLAYLLDRQTIAVVDLSTGVQLGQWWHEARVDWLELNESGQLLLLRDTRRRLALLQLHTGDKEIIASGVGFVQWIENSDAVVAQTPTHLLIWYRAWDPSSVEMAECGGGVVVEVTANRVILEGGQLPYLQLDEHRLAFNNALRDGDLAGCARYLDGVSSNAEVASLWRQLAEQALANNDIQLAAKCYREVSDDARTFDLDKTVEIATHEGNGDIETGLTNPIVRARLAIFSGDLSAAEECYVKRANKPALAIDMYKQFNRWSDAIALAEKTDRSLTGDLKQQHMDYLTSTGRYGEAGAVLASSGDAQGAVKLWLRGGRARRAAALILQHPYLLRENELVEAVHGQLIKEEWWEMAGEISERRGDSRTAVDYYAKGNNYARAVQLARETCPGEVIELERSWGHWLVGLRQAGAAVPHLIEAGDTRGALAAALKAHHYNKALQIIQAIEDKESIKEQCEQLGEHYIAIQEWETAERVLTTCGMAERCVRAYNTAGRVSDGLRLSAAHLSEEDTRDIYMPLAEQLRQDGQLRKAEQIYIGLGEPDEAISMYKEATQYEAMLRLVGAHRSELLEATRRHVAQALHAHGDLRAAENYYIQAGDWKSAIQMYRTAGQWEGAERVARAHAPNNVQQQVALQWAAVLGGAPAARLLSARGLAALGARWALQAQRWDIAMELSELGGGITRREVSRHEAAALAEDHPEEAEAAFLRASAPEDAVRMWLTKGSHQRALTLAEEHAPHMVEEVLVEGARAAAERGDLPQFETLMIRANRPREVVQHYKDLELWEEATRVSREYLPESGEPVPGGVPELLSRGAAHAERGEWWGAVRALCAASAAAAAPAPRLAERAALRAARLARDHLHEDTRVAAAHMLAERFAAIGQSEIGEQLRAALTEGYSTADDEAPGASAEYEAEEASAAQTHEADTEAEAESEALERLARAGHWARCLAHAGRRAPHYALRYAAHLFKAHPRMESIDIGSEEASEPLSQAIEALRQHLATDSSESVASSDAPLAKAVCAEILVRVSMAPKAITALTDAAVVMPAAGADDRSMQALTLLMALHVPQIAGKAARALPRYSDIIVADVAFYVSGMSIRGEGSGGAREAFVLLNRCLDLAEAAEDDSAHLLDYADFECTDWSRQPLLMESGCIRGSILDEVREWVLAVSMDQAVEQTLPVDSRGFYSSYVGDSEQCCVLTGYPLSERLVTFTNGRCANRENWSRVSSAARNGGAAASMLQHITHWCGPADYTHL